MSKTASKRKFTPPQIDLKKLFVILGAIAIGYIVMYVYFEPARPQSVVLSQSDILQVKGMSKEIEDFRKKDKGEALWTSRMFGGMPTYQINTLYPSNLLTKVDKALRLGLPHPAGHIFKLFLGMFILLLVLRLDPWVALAGGLAYAFSSYFFIAMEAGHNAKINALGYAPMVLGGIMLTYRGRLLLGGALFTFSLAMELLANHFQITYYLLFIIIALAISELAMSVQMKYRYVLLALLIVPIIWMVDPCNDLQAVWIGLTGLVLAVPIILQFLAAKDSGGWNSHSFSRTRQFVLGSVILLIGGGIAALPNLGRLYTTAEYKSDTMRGGVVLENANHCTGGQAALSAGEDVEAGECGRTGGLKKPYAYNWSYGVGETFTLISPFVTGDASSTNIGNDSETYSVLNSVAGPQQAAQSVRNWPTYFGDQPFTSGPVYVGAGIFFLFVLGLLVVGDRYRWWLLGATIISILLSWGKNWQWFSDLFFDHFPLYNNFRAVSMTLVIAGITMPILAAIALQVVLNSTPEKKEYFKKMILIAGGACVAILLGIYAFQSGGDFYTPKDDATLQRIAGQNGSLLMQLKSALIEDRQTLFTTGIWRSIGLVIAMMAVLYGFVGYLKDKLTNDNRWLGQLGAGVAVLIVLMADLVPIAKRYISEENFVPRRQFMARYNPTAADQEILADADKNFRVLNLSLDPWNDAFTSYHHKNIGGYHAAKFRRYQDLIDCHLDAERREIITGLQGGQYDQVLRNTSTLNMLNMKYIMVPTQGNRIQNIQNPHRYGIAWNVGEVKMVGTNVAEIEALDDTNLKNVAVVHTDFEEYLQGFTPEKDAAMTITLAGYEPNHITYNYNAPSGKEQLVVFSEIYYAKGWNAYVDGNLIDHVRANYVLRAARIPGGQHKIEFKFEPASYELSETVGLIGSLLVILVVLGVAALWFTGRLSEPQDPELQD